MYKSKLQNSPEEPPKSKLGQSSHSFMTHFSVIGSHAILRAKSWHLVGISILSQHLLIPVHSKSTFSQSGHRQLTCGILLYQRTLFWGSHNGTGLKMKWTIAPHHLLFVEDQQVLGMSTVNISRFGTGDLH